MGVVSCPVFSLVPLQITRRVMRFDGSTGIRTPALRSETFSPWTSVDPDFQWGISYSQSQILDGKGKAFSDKDTHYLSNHLRKIKFFPVFDILFTWPMCMPAQKN
jgi:hypothetical protein